MYGILLDLIVGHPIGIADLVEREDMHVDRQLWTREHTCILVWLIVEGSARYPASCCGVLMIKPPCKPHVAIGPIDFGDQLTSFWNKGIVLRAE